MVTTEQLADWHRRLDDALRCSVPDAETFQVMRDVAKEIEQAWLEAVRRERES